MFIKTEAQETCNRLLNQQVSSEIHSTYFHF